MTTITKNLRVLSLIEGLLGVASEYQGCNGAMLPPVEITNPRDGNMLISTGTNLLEKTASWLTEPNAFGGCTDELDPQEEEMSAALSDVDRAILLRIKQLAEDMLKVEA